MYTGRIFSGAFTFFPLTILPSSKKIVNCVLAAANVYVKQLSLSIQPSASLNGCISLEKKPLVSRQRNRHIGMGRESLNGLGAG